MKGVPGKRLLYKDLIGALPPVGHSSDQSAGGGARAN
jgi:hypothetical protein